MKPRDNLVGEDTGGCDIVNFADDTFGICGNETVRVDTDGCDIVGNADKESTCDND